MPPRESLRASARPRFRVGIAFLITSPLAFLMWIVVGARLVLFATSSQELAIQPPRAARLLDTSRREQFNDLVDDRQRLIDHVAVGIERGELQARTFKASTISVSKLGATTAGVPS